MVFLYLYFDNCSVLGGGATSAIRPVFHAAPVPVAKLRLALLKLPIQLDKLKVRRVTIPGYHRIRGSGHEI